MAIALATVLGMGADYTQLGTVAAHDCVSGLDPVDMHSDFQKTPVSCSSPTHQDTHEHTIEVDGGRYRDMVFKAYVPREETYYDSGNDSIDILFHRSFDLPASVPSNGNLITVDDSGDGDPVNVTEATVNGKTLTLRRPYHMENDIDSNVQSGEYITITIKAGAKIETPETPQGFDGFEGEKPYEVFITFVDGDPPNGEVEAEDKNFVIVKNPTDSTVPNTAVRVELATHAETNISTADDIMVDFSGPSADSGFALPSSVATSRIKVFYKDGTSERSFNPSEVQIEGQRVIFSVPADKDENPITFIGDYRIEFSKLARVRNPFSAGIKTIRVSSFVDGDLEDIIETVVRRTTTVNPQEGPRGSEFKLEGKGYAPGTVTVYHDADGDRTIDAGETLASVKTVRGAFNTNLTARGNPGEEQYRVRARDSEGDDVSVGFAIRSAMSFEPNPVGIGSSLKIIISDWERERNQVVAVQIAGETVFVADAVEYENCIEHPNAANRDSRGDVTLIVNVPINTPPGEQTVAVYDHAQLDYERVGRTPKDVEDDTDSCQELGEESGWGQLKGELRSSFRTDDPIAITKATVEIATKSLTISPSTAVLGQKVTISGSGFTHGPDEDISSVTINGHVVPEDPAQFVVSHDGRVSMTVTVPKDVRDGENEVRATGWDYTLGTGTLTVPEPSIELDSPSELDAPGNRQGSRVTVRGSGFPANGIVLLSYGAETVGAGETDGMGNFENSFDVPLSADIGRTNRVMAVMNVETESTEDPIKFEAGADHTPPSATVATRPEPAREGGQMTVLGENFPPFALVGSLRFAHRDITPVPNISTDRNGRFETEIDVEGIAAGDQTLRVEISGVVVTHMVEVAEPPPGGLPSEVFRDLIDAEALLRVWYLERYTQRWYFFDPSPEFANFNNLDRIPLGEVASIHLSSPHEFQGEMLYAGWNHMVIR